jgi:hypothetical protein
MPPPASLPRFDSDYTLEYSRRSFVLWSERGVPPVVNKESTNTPRSGIEILVRAPDCKVDVPIVEAKRDVANGVCQIPPYHRSLSDNLALHLGLQRHAVKEACLPLPRGGNSLHGKPLACVVLDTTENNQSNGISFLFNHVKNVRLAKGKLALSGGDFNDGGLCFKAVRLCLRCECILRLE